MNFLFRFVFPTVISNGNTMGTGNHLARWDGWASKEELLNSVTFGSMAHYSAWSLEIRHD